MLLKMSEMSRFCPALASYICCLYFSHVSHYNLTTFESNTIESIGHWCDLSKLEEHCRNGSYTDKELPVNCGIATVVDVY